MKIVWFLLLLVVVFGFLDPVGFSSFWINSNGLISRILFMFASISNYIFSFYRSSHGSTRRFLIALIGILGLWPSRETHVLCSKVVATVVQGDCRRRKVELDVVVADIVVLVEERRLYGVTLALKREVEIWSTLFGGSVHWAWKIIERMNNNGNHNVIDREMKDANIGMVEMVENEK